MTKYVTEVKEHLSKYKQKKYPEIGNGIWKKNKQKYSHIFPETNKYNNLLPSYRDDLIKYIETPNLKLKLHSDFHHLNSSQAMCLNFFYPLIIEQKLDIILDFLHLKGEQVDYATVCFEKDGIEKTFGRVPTSFDFYFKTISKKKFYFEIKYTEDGFRKEKKDKEHIDKFDKIYANLLEPIAKEFRSRDRFLGNYQILRNLIHINENSYVIFLYPYNNQKIITEAENAISMLANDFKGNFFPKTWEDLYKYVKNSSKDNRLVKQLLDFEKKYFIY